MGIAVEEYISRYNAQHALLSQLRQEEAPLYTHAFNGGILNIRPLESARPFLRVSHVVCVAAMDASANAGITIKDGSFEHSTYVRLTNSFKLPPKDESLPFHDDKPGYLKLIEALQHVPLAQVLQVS